MAVPGWQTLASPRRAFLEPHELKIWRAGRDQQIGDRSHSPRWRIAARRDRSWGCWQPARSDTPEMGPAASPMPSASYQCLQRVCSRRSEPTIRTNQTWHHALDACTARCATKVFFNLMPGDLCPIPWRVPFSVMLVCMFAQSNLLRRVCWGWRKCRQLWACCFLGVHDCGHV